VRRAGRLKPLQSHLPGANLSRWRSSRAPEASHLGKIGETVAPEVDFVSVHIYPEKGKVDQALSILKMFAVDKPVVVEETFLLFCPASDVEEFLKQSRPTACGWMGHYDGITVEQMDALRKANKLGLKEAFFLDWLELFRRLGPAMAPQTE
jgi:hypothetical protein